MATQNPTDKNTSTNTDKMSVNGVGIKPVWPWPDLVNLKWHKHRKCWRLIYKRKDYYFQGTPAEALAEYRVRWPVISGQAKESAPVVAERPLLGEIARRWYADKEAQNKAGKLASSTLRGYRQAAAIFVMHTGAGRIPDALKPEDFANVTAKYKVGINRQKTFITALRGMFTWAVDARLMDRPPAYGDSFTVPGLRALRAHRATVGPRDIAPAQIWRLLEATNKAPRLQAMVWLGINAAFGLDDMAALPASAIKGDELRWPRPKTLVVRMAWLWPETVAALDRLPRDKKTGIVFPKSTARHMFTVWATVFELAGIPDRRIYDLRRTFATIAAEHPDTEARELVMGHALETMSETYIQRFKIERVQGVCQHVRAWLFQGQSDQPAPAPAPAVPPAPAPEPTRGR